jgi:polar amino acid transport system substrate-binding protein
MQEERLMPKKSLYLILVIVVMASMLLAAQCPPPAPPTAAPIPTKVPEPTKPPKLKITVATDATWPPFEFVDEQTKEIVGFDIDLMNAIAKEADLEVEYINVGWDPLLAGMAAGQYDAAISAMTITEERKKQFNFSDPYYNAGQLIVVRAEQTDIAKPEDLAGHTVGAQIGTTGAIAVEKISGATLKTYDTIDLAYMDLVNGQIDAVVADNPLAVGYVNLHKPKLKTVGEPFTEEEYGIAVRKGADEALARINKGLKIVLDQGIIKKLEDKWLTEPME